MGETRRPLLSGDGDAEAALSSSTAKPEDAFLSAGGAASSLAGVFNLSTTIVGAGVMALPHAFRTLGIVGGAVGLLVVHALTRYTVALLLRGSTTCREATYAGLLHHYFGPEGRRGLDVCITLNNFGILVVYLILIGDVLCGSASARGVLSAWTGAAEGSAWVGRPLVVALVTGVVLLPLCSLRQMASLRFSSAFGLSMSGLFICATGYLTVKAALDGKLDLPPKLLPSPGTPPTQILSTLSVIITAYVCHYNIHPILVDLATPTASNMGGVASVALGLCSCIYFGVASAGSLLFGDDTKEDVLLNFDASEPLGGALKLGYAFALMMTFPLIFFSFRESVAGLLGLAAAESGASVTASLSTRAFMGTTVVGLTCMYLLGTHVPNIDVVFAFSGSTVTVMVGFLLPGGLALRMGRVGEPVTTTWGATLACALGLAAMALGLWVAALDV